MIYRGIKYLFLVSLILIGVGCGRFGRKTQISVKRPYPEKEKNYQMEFGDDHLGLGRSLFYKGDIKGAIKEFEIAAKESPSFAEIHYNLGLANYKLGNLSKAIENYKMALKINQNLTEAYFNLGVVYDQIGQLEDALQAYEKALKYGLDDAAPHFNRGVILLKLCRFEEAKSENLRALEIDPTLAEAYNNLGYVAETEVDVEKAIEMYKKSLNLKPDYKIAKENLERLLKGPVAEGAPKIEKGILSRVNLEMDGRWAFEKNIDLDDSVGKAEVGSKNKDLLFRLGFDVTNWLDLFVDLGISDLEFEDNSFFEERLLLKEKYGDKYPQDINFKYEGFEKVFGPIVGCGLNADIFRFKRLNLAFDTGLEILIGINEDNVKIANDDSYKGTAEWKDYMLSLRTRYLGLRNFVPFGGIFFNKLDGNFEIKDKNNIKTDIDYNESNPFGILLGGSYYFGRHLRFQTEAKVLNEVALAVRAKYSF